MHTTADIPEVESKADQGNGAPSVEVRDLHKSYGKQKVLNGVSLSVDRGKTLAVLGRSGTGKSVMLRIIIGIAKPDSGSVLIHGQDTTGMSVDELGAVRMKMGFLFQHAALYDSMSVAENVAFPMEHHRRDLSRADRNERVQQLLSEVGLAGHGSKMPANISGGMQKRAGLARALALEPDILLLDEPTAGLDPISSGEIDELVMKLREQHDMASIVVTHDMHSAKTIADRLALLDKGSVVEQGTFAELEASNNEFVREFLKHA